jgi:hypothetical protein
MGEKRVAVYLDIENLIHPFRETGQWSDGLEVMNDLICWAAKMGTVVAGLGVCDRTAWRHVAVPLADLGVRVFSHAGGLDAADLALIEHIETGLPSSASTVVIASGDHAFAAVASNLRVRGRHVVAVALAGALSHELYRSVDEVRLLPYRATQSLAA